MINSNDLQERIIAQQEVSELLNGSLLEGPYIGRSILIKEERNVEKILSNRMYASKLLTEHGYKLTVAGGSNGIKNSIKIEW